MSRLSRSFALYFFTPLAFLLLVCSANAQGPRPITQKQAQTHVIKQVAVPPDALGDAANLTGVVKLHVIVGKDGRVAAIKSISGHPMLVQRAIAAVKQWEYKPFIREGKAIAVAFDLVVTV